MAEDFRELEEQAEEAAQHNLAPVTVTMAILAVLVAAVSLLGHRAHTEEIVEPDESNRSLGLLPGQRDPPPQLRALCRRNVRVRPAEIRAGRQNQRKVQKEIERYKEEGQDIQAEARKAEEEVAAERRHANYFDLGEVLLEAALVICSITVLTRKRFFWYLGTAWD